MSFASPWLLLFLLLVPLGIGGYVLLERRRARQAARWTSAALLPNMAPASPGRRRYLPLAFFLIALVLLLAGFARPQAMINVPREGATIVLALDVSGSMEAKDVAPTRLLAARAALRQFVNDVPESYRISLVTFSDHAAVRVTPTDDHERVVLRLPTKAQAEGTALSSGIAAAIKVAQVAAGKPKPGEPRSPSAILLLSDGAQTVGREEPAAVAAKARTLGIPIYTVSLGTDKGVVTRKIEGGEEVIQVPPAPDALREISQMTGGRFFEAGTPERLREVYKAVDSQLVKDRKKREITVAAAGGAVLFLIAGALLSGLWFRRVV